MKYLLWHINIFGGFNKKSSGYSVKVVSSFSKLDIIKHLPQQQIHPIEQQKYTMVRFYPNQEMLILEKLELIFIPARSIEEYLLQNS